MEDWHSQVFTALDAEHAPLVVVRGRMPAPQSLRLIHTLTARYGTDGIHVVRAQPLTGGALRRHASPGEVQPDADPPGWPVILDRVARAGRILVLEGLEHLADQDRTLIPALARARATHGNALRMVAFTGDEALAQELADVDSPFTDPMARLVEAAPDPVFAIHAAWPGYERMAAHVRGWPAVDALRAWCVFGADPDRLPHVDPDRSLEENAVRLLLTPGALGFDAPVHELRLLFQTPGRYGDLLSALSGGARTWAELLDGADGFEQGGPMAPYLKRLEAAHLVRSSRSLDAGPRTRKQRYALVDPGLAFWFRFVLPLHGRLIAGQMTPSEAWRSEVVPHLATHCARYFGEVCRRFVELAGAPGLDGEPVQGGAGASVRELGSLWGDGYDLPVVGTMTDGSVVYGVCLWEDRPVGEAVVDRLREEVRNARYGFGREHRRFRIFVRERPARSLRDRVFRSPEVRWIEAGALADAARLHAESSP